MYLLEYDARSGRRWNTDALQPFFAPYSPYNYAFNNPILWNDPDGLGPKGTIKQAVEDIKGWVNRNVLGKTHSGIKLDKIETEEREVTFKQRDVLADVNQNDFESGWDKNTEKPIYKPLEREVTKQKTYADWKNVSEVKYKFNNIKEGERLSITRPNVFGGQTEVFNDQHKTTETGFFKINRLLIFNANDILNLTFKCTLVYTPEWTAAPDREITQGLEHTSIDAGAFTYHRSFKTTVKIRGTGKYFEALKKTGVIK
jgi:hypothetical protein